jgi:hypothetical protein
VLLDLPWAFRLTTQTLVFLATARVGIDLEGMGASPGVILKPPPDLKRPPLIWTSPSNKPASPDLARAWTATESELGLASAGKPIGGPLSGGRVAITTTPTLRERLPRAKPRTPMLRVGPSCAAPPRKTAVRHDNPPHQKRTCLLTSAVAGVAIPSVSVLLATNAKLPIGSLSSGTDQAIQQ